MLMPSHSKILLLAILTLFAGSLHAACTWRIGISDRLPYHGYDKNNNPAGIEVELIASAAATLGCQVNYAPMPWKRQFIGVKNGTLDVLLGPGKRKDRELLLYYFEPYAYEPSVLVLPKEAALQAHFHKLADVLSLPRNFVIGSLVGVSYSDNFDMLMKNPDFAGHIYLVPEQETSLKMLSAGRLQGAFFPDASTPMEAAKNLGLAGRFALLPIDQGVDDYAYITYSKKTLSEAQAKRVADVVDRVVNSAKFDRILRKYVDADTAKIIKARVSSRN